MQTPYFPAAAAEFPNDNPALHRGARWVCRAGRGAARAFLDARQLPPVVADPAPERGDPKQTSSLGPARVAELVRTCRGPLELDLKRLVLPHRVQDIPPPPEFVFQPFVSSRRSSPSAPPAAPLQPLGCRVIDQQDSGRRIDRRWRVDIAPCLSVESPPEVPATAAPALRRRRRAPLVRGPALVLLELSRALTELEAAFAERPHTTATTVRRLPAAPGTAPAAL
ncbi:MAG TPA: hypothetical protein VG963_28000 [Polyangiaceae bacterium]|nr:hypothetical protein [Polyangiaceae bacterium]